MIVYGDSPVHKKKGDLGDRKIHPWLMTATAY